MANEKENNNYRIGEVYLMRFEGRGTEQSGLRPGLIFQNNVGNAHSPNVIALPLTSSIKNEYLPTHVFLPAKHTGLLRDSMVLCENPERMSKSRIGAYLTTIPDKFMEEVAVANLIATSAISYIDYTALLSVWKRAIELNTTVTRG